MAIKDPNSPLYGKENVSGRGYTRHYYTIQDISKLTHRSEGTIRNDASSRKVDLDSIASVFWYCGDRVFER